MLLISGKHTRAVCAASSATLVIVTRVVAHVDLDAFFAAVEVLEHPAYAGKPVVVGGSPFGRGVVATASYEARRFGIRSAMPSAEARRRCPDAVFVTPNHALYSTYSRRVWGLISDHVSIVEQVGLDEGYLDMSGVVETAGNAQQTLRSLQARIGDATGLSASFGCGTSKVVAKVASDYRKPAGVTVVAAGREAAFLAPLPLRALPGIGPKADERLRQAGLVTVGDLASLSDERINRLVPGVIGVDLRNRARGVDPRTVAPAGPASSISCEETFDRDVTSGEQLVPILLRLVDDVCERLARQERGAQTVTVKLRYPDFAIATRSQTAQAPFRDRDEVSRLALLALERAMNDRSPPVRLLGVGVSRLVQGEQLRLPFAPAYDQPSAAATPW
jgi:DNA polymerase IV